MHPLIRGVRLLAAVTLISLAAASAHASATITIINGDSPGEGFNDPTPAAPVGGNPGTTLGAQRLFVFQYAANIWASTLTSTVEIRVNAHMDPQTCDASGAVLGSASAGSSHRGFPNAPFGNTWYQQALANKLAGSDLNPGVDDINITFNSSLNGMPPCSFTWYYGVDGNEGAAVELLPVVLHELGHGLGFATITFAGVQMGTPPGPHIYDRFLFDRTQGIHWPDMTDGQRAASTQNCSNVVWDGPRVVAASQAELGPKPVLRVNSPGAIAGDKEVGTAAFGPALGSPGVTADVVLVNDGSSPPNSPNNGCETPYVNAAALVGKIAFVDRGTCTFTTKVKNCQNAGAVGVIVSDSAAGCPPPGLGGADPTITIPAVRVTQTDGNNIKIQLGIGTVNATLTADPTLDAGADNLGRVLVYTPVPFAPGSSVSHWDVSANPNLLMEPAINTNLHTDLDLTLEQMIDIGWFPDLVGVDDRRIAADVFLGAPRPNPTAAGAAVTFRVPRAEFVRLTVMDVNGRVIRSLQEGMMPPGEHTRRWDGKTDRLSDAPMGVYVVVLRTAEGVKSQRLVLAR